MAHRKELIDIARAISGSFNSRNNDFNGYCALGILYELTNKNQATSLTFNLLKHGPTFDLTVLQSITNKYHCLLLHLLKAKNINIDWLTQATLTINFNKYNKIHHGKMIYPIGDPYISVCELQDDMAKTYQSIHYGKCLIHS